MSPTHKTNHSLTLKRRRGRRNLKDVAEDVQHPSNDMDGIERALPNSNTLSQRPSSSGAAYLGCAPGSHNQRLASEEPFSHAACAPEFSRSMTESGMTASASSSSLLGDQPVFPEWWNDLLENSSQEIPHPPRPSSPLPVLHTPQSPDNVAVHRLPNELLALIFEQGSSLASRTRLQPKYPLMPVRPVNTISFMLTVLHVCHRWREVAMHTPSLWTSLLVSHPMDVEAPDPNSNKLVDWVENALKRSQNLPLDITIDCTHISPTSAIKQLIPESHRWRSLSIVVPGPQSLPLILSTLREVDAPTLEGLEITANKVDRLPVTEQCPPFFISCPKLAHVRLNRVRLLWDANPLHHLTSLELRFVIWPDFLDLRQVFLRSPTLEHLVLHFDNYAFARLDREGRAPIPIPCLRSLELRFFYDDSPNIVSLIQLFTVPTLECLTLKNLSCADWCRVLPYFRSYAASYPALRSLTVCNIRGLVCVDSSTVRAFPHLTHLSLIGVYSNAFSQLLLNERTEDGYNVLVWPKLRSLWVQNDMDTKMELLKKAIDSRMSLGRPITRLVLDQHLFEGHPEVIQCLRQSVKVENASYIHD
ncbi:hypothetical protein E1B28_011582 [Marasmius oreades]|uniref:F-box domain-containing protein n=1 Tax=Marasmius oreades TaxID=181124 RepID=A0A9P7UPR1_9AGAR|nr:uncharacterized protein E1B28_011582 [Marasmius oreades]KAG7089957.1 hypothetical protein E1B28_011582 [Marasmius oreades]